MSRSTPKGSATFEEYGIRGIEGDNLIRQIAPLNQRYSTLGTTSYIDGHPLTDEEKLWIDIETDILRRLMGSESTHRDEVPEKVTQAYQRTFNEWATLLLRDRPNIDEQQLMQQLTVAWHNITELLLNSPR